MEQKNRKDWLQRDIINLVSASKHTEDIIANCPISTNMQGTLAISGEYLTKISAHLFAVETYLKNNGKEYILNNKIVSPYIKIKLANTVMSDKAKRYPQDPLVKDVLVLEAINATFKDLSIDYINLHDNCTDEHMFSRTRIFKELLTKATQDYKILATELLSPQFTDSQRQELYDQFAEIDAKFEAENDSVSEA